MNQKILHTEGKDALHLWWELSYAQYLTIPRLVMQSMPDEWQGKMAALLEEMDETFEWRPKDGRYWVQLKDSTGKYMSDPLCNYRHGHLGEEYQKLAPQPDSEA